MKRLQPARHGARALEACVLRLVSRDSEHSDALACSLRGCLLCVTARSCVDEEKPLAGAVPLCHAWRDYGQRGKARTCRQRPYSASSRETASAVARLRARHPKACCVLEAGAGTSQHGLAPMERGLLMVRYRCIVRDPITTSAARRARVASVRAALRLERQLAQWRARASATRKPALRWRPQVARRSTVLRQSKEASRRRSALVMRVKRLQPSRHGARVSQACVLRLISRDSERSGALACSPLESLLCVGGRSWHVAARSCADGERPLDDVVPSHRARLDYNQRGTARACRKRAGCASS